jgi:hypothetical protein
MGNIYGNYTSHRTEAYGVLCSISILSMIQKYRHTTKNIKKRTKAIILCDNEAVVNKINSFNHQSTKLKDYYSADFDLISEIIAVIKDMKKYNITIWVKHIKGHQDNKK